VKSFLKLLLVLHLLISVTFFIMLVTAGITNINQSNTMEQSSYLK